MTYIIFLKIYAVITFMFILAIVIMFYLDEEDKLSDSFKEKWCDYIIIPALFLIGVLPIPCLFI